MMKIFYVLLLFIMGGVLSNAQNKSDKLKPRWITYGLPQNISPSYLFMDASGTGNSLEEARQRSLLNLSIKLEHERGIKVSSSIKVNSKTMRQDGNRNQVSRLVFEMECIENGKEITMLTRCIDEYWECNNDTYICYTLYTVADKNSQGGSYDDQITLTTKYGFKGTFLSLIPGAGQLYKGNVLKGSLIMSSEIACASMVVVAENLRASYIKKMKEQPRYKEKYNTKADNWKNIRNGVIGAAAAIYLYNLIDASIAPGRRRVIVKQQRKLNLSLRPNLENESTGMALTLTF